MAIITGEPTTEQLQAVIDYSRRWGPRWKTKLLDAWHYGIPFREPDSALLQQVRNEFGPTWIDKQPKEYPL